MQQIVQVLRERPAAADPHAPEPAILAVLSDAGLVQAVAHAIAAPKRSRDTSFTLHAPMDLFARAALLPLIRPDMRMAARMRIANIAALYAEGEEIAAPEMRVSSIQQTKSILITALRQHDPDTADAAVVALAPHLSAPEFCTLLTDEIAANLGAAAHAPLLLVALVDAAARYGNLSILLRTAIRALATAPGAKLTWIDQPADLAGPKDLWDALAQPPRVVAASTSISPTMLAVEQGGMASRQLGRAAQEAPEAAAKSLLRIAALAMLADEPAHAPYGWTHCLTLPQGLMALVPYTRDPGRLVRTAATHVLGFRATLGKVGLPGDWQPTISPDVTALATRAAAHEDAHLAKYTIACLTAAAADPPARPLFLAAAAYLGEWWDARPGAGYKD